MSDGERDKKAGREKKEDDSVINNADLRGERGDKCSTKKKCLSKVQILVSNSNSHSVLLCCVKI